MKNKYLKYTDYKKDQALWLQRKDSERTNRGTNTEQFCIECYISYLNICGLKKWKGFKMINELVMEKLNTYGQFGKGKSLDEFVYKNVDEIMDSLTSYI